MSLTAEAIKPMEPFLACLRIYLLGWGIFSCKVLKVENQGRQPNIVVLAVPRLPLKRALGPFCLIFFKIFLNPCYPQIYIDILMFSIGIRQILNKADVKEATPIFKLDFP